MNLPLSTAFTESLGFGFHVFIFICFYAYFDFFCDLLVIESMLFILHMFVFLIVFFPHS